MLWLICFILCAAPVYLILDWLLRSLRIYGFESKSVVITGCDSGFGKALALRLDAIGFNVFAGCLTKDGETNLSSQASEKLRPFHLDVTSSKSVQKSCQLIKEALSTEQSLWAIVNNAGIAGQTGPPELNEVIDYKRAFDVNLFGPMEMCRIFLPLIRRSKGRIVNITSAAGRIAGAEGPYCASKFGLEGYTDLLRRELYLQGVKVCILEPGFFKTNILDASILTKGLHERMKNADDETKAVYGDEFLSRFSRRMKLAAKLAEPNLDPVTNAYVHAIVSRYPRTRYIIGFNARFVFMPATYLPDWVLNLAVPRALSSLNKTKK